MREKSTKTRLITPSSSLVVRREELVIVPHSLHKATVNLMEQVPQRNRPFSLFCMVSLLSEQREILLRFAVGFHEFHGRKLGFFLYILHRHPCQMPGTENTSWNSRVLIIAVISSIQ